MRRVRSDERDPVKSERERERKRGSRETRDELLER